MHTIQQAQIYRNALRCSVRREKYLQSEQTSSLAQLRGQHGRKTHSWTGSLPGLLIQICAQSRVVVPGLTASAALLGAISPRHASWQRKYHEEKLHFEKRETTCLSVNLPSMAGISLAWSGHREFPHDLDMFPSLHGWGTSSVRNSRAGHCLTSSPHPGPTSNHLLSRAHV